MSAYLPARIFQGVFRMTCQRDTRGRDRLSLVLLVMALASLSAATAMAVSTGPAEMPDHLLDRVRGSNPAWTRANNGDCTSLNVAAANWPVPPIPPYVGFANCVYWARNVSSVWRAKITGIMTCFRITECSRRPSRSRTVRSIVTPIRMERLGHANSGPSACRAPRWVYGTVMFWRRGMGFSSSSPPRACCSSRDPERSRRLGGT